MTADVTLAPTLPPRGLLSRLRGRGLPWVSMIILALVVIAAIFGEVIAPHDPNGLNLGVAFRPPVWAPKGEWAYPLGTDNLGRDILSRIITGARVSLVSALYAIVFAGSIGALVGRSRAISAASSTPSSCRLTSRCRSRRWPWRW